MREKKQEDVQLGRNIRRAREAAGLTQEALAERVSLGTKNISAIERGAVGISVPALRRICQALAVSSDALLFGPLPEDAPACQLARRLGSLTPERFALVRDILEKLLKAFEL